MTTCTLLIAGLTAYSMLTHDGRRMVSRAEGTNTVYELVPTNQLPANLPPVREWREDDAVDAALRERRGSVLGCACNCVAWQKSRYDFVQTGPKVGTIPCGASCATCDNLVYYARLQRNRRNRIETQCRVI